jgi:hypothetical protein
VSGVWKFDPDKSLTQMARYDEHLTPEQRQEYSGRYIVRVSVKRPTSIQYGPPLGKWVEYVVVPPNWSHDASAISDDPKVINIGDVVDVWTQKRRYYAFLIALVRQCDAPRPVGENINWNIGCRTHENFDERGFAGNYDDIRWP